MSLTDWKLSKSSRFRLLKIDFREMLKNCEYGCRVLETTTVYHCTWFITPHGWPPTFYWCENPNRNKYNTLRQKVNNISWKCTIFPLILSFYCGCKLPFERLRIQMKNDLWLCSTPVLLQMYYPNNLYCYSSVTALQNVDNSDRSRKIMLDYHVIE